MNWTSPLKPQKALKEPKEETIKKEKCRIPKGAAKSIVAAKGMDEVGAKWVERWIDQWVRENSYPPQLVSGEFVALLGKWLDPATAMAALERLRTEYKKAFSWMPDDDDFAYLHRAIASDAVARDWMEAMSHKDLESE